MTTESRWTSAATARTAATLIHIRRAHRVQIAADIDRELPGLGEAERRQVLEDRMREYTAAARSAAQSEQIGNWPPHPAQLAG
ncbi:hypothetical protein [Streptomyces mirabilis]|uniref:hypothetical protein n=1 Tax=Streptomyces mirabilis TaxID=68239 RepID=UPI0036A4A717